MASWAARNKFIYSSIAFVFISLVVGVPVFLFFYKAPTCTDGRKNQNESGVDCGGSCPRLCPADFSPVAYVWERYQKIAPGLYSVLAYVENPNISVEASNVPYSFSLYDRDGTVITTRSGKTSIPAGKRFAIFESALTVKERVPVKATFEFTALPQWVRAEGQTLARVESSTIFNEGTFPRVEASIKNIGRSILRNLEAVAIVYNSEGNAIAFSRTTIDQVSPDDVEDIAFTWQEKFSSEQVRVDILVRPR